jgi:hypothetical protein
MARKKSDSAPLTTAQRLGSLVKSARDIMRKDKGLNGGLDHLPMLTWIVRRSRPPKNGIVYFIQDTVAPHPDSGGRDWPASAGKRGWCWR